MRSTKLPATDDLWFGFVLWPLKYSMPPNAARISLCAFFGLRRIAQSERAKILKSWYGPVSAAGRGEGFIPQMKH